MMRAATEKKKTTRKMESLDIIKCIYDITADKRHCMVD